MNMKKLVSSVAAFAMTASVFAGLAVTASAESIYTNDCTTLDGWTKHGDATMKNSDHGVSVYVTSSSISGNRACMFTFPEQVTSIKEGKINVSFDLYFASDAGLANRGTRQIALVDSSSSATADGKDPITSGTIWSAALAYSGPVNNAVVYDTKFYLNGDTEKTFEMKKQTVYTVSADLNLDANLATVKVTDPAGTTVSTVANTSFAGDSVKGLYILAPRGCYTTEIDNISVSTVESTGEETYAEVSFNVNVPGAKVMVGANDATNGITLEEGAYNYVVTAPGYDTVKGSFEVASGETEKVIDVTMTAIPAAPANTNSQEEKSQSETLFADSFVNATVNIPVTLTTADAGAIEFDVYVPEDGSFSFTLGNVNATGPDVSFAESNGTTSVTYTTSSTAKPTSLGSYPSKQWVHVKAEFVTGENTGDDKGGIRLASYKVTITPKESGNAFSGTPNVRNLATSFSGTRVYSFEQVKIGGGANVANSEMYVLAPEEVSVPATKIEYTKSETDTAAASAWLVTLPADKTSGSIEWHVTIAGEEYKANSETVITGVVTKMGLIIVSETDDDLSADDVTAVQAVLK